MKSKHSLSERFNYWFDNRMAKGGLGLIKILAIASAFVVVIVSVAIAISQNLTGGGTTSAQQFGTV